MDYRGKQGRSLVVLWLVDTGLRLDQKSGDLRVAIQRSASKCRHPVPLSSVVDVRSRLEEFARNVRLPICSALESTPGRQSEREMATARTRVARLRTLRDMHQDSEAAVVLRIEPLVVLEQQWHQRGMAINRREQRRSEIIPRNEVDVRLGCEQQLDHIAATALCSEHL